MRTQTVRVMVGLGRWAAEMRSWPPGRIVVVRRQLRNPSNLDRRRPLKNAFRQDNYEPGWSLSIARKPIKHRCIGIVVGCFPGRPASGVDFPVCVGKTFSVLVVRVACVDVLERCLRKGEHQA
ncbi:MAG: hypothetical protein ACRD7E_11725, partial [Bryobacteraceae bacterium]